MKRSALWVLLSLQLMLSPPVASADEAVIEDQVSFQVEVGREVDNDRVVAAQCDYRGPRPGQSG
jgi:predicted secreted protein